MSGGRKFSKLRPADQLLLVWSLLLVAGVRLGLWLLPVRTVRRLLLRRKATGGNPWVDVDRSAWAVQAAGRRIPKATCLVQALAGEALLGRLGVPVRLRIGVARGPDGKFLAHAWLEHRGRVVIGQLPDLDSFTSLTSPE